MALIKAVILPHSPLLIPEIGRANYSFLNKTNAAYKQISQDLKDSGVDTLIIISPHGPSQRESLTLNVAPEMTIDLKDFGFIPQKTIIKGDSLLSDQIKNALAKDLPLQLISDPILDYGSAIPAYLLKTLGVNFKIIVLIPGTELSLAEHLKFGAALQTVITNSEKKIGVISSSDLSHRLKKKSPAGYSPKGAKFDNKLIEYLSDPETARNNILGMDQKLITEAGECGLKPIIVLLGILTDKNPETHILSYQTDFGVGYLSLDFSL